MDHSQLGNSYHAGMIAGVALITQGLEQSLSVKDPVSVFNYFKTFQLFSLEYLFTRTCSTWLCPMTVYLAFAISLSFI